MKLLTGRDDFLSSHKKVTPSSCVRGASPSRRRELFSHSETFLAGATARQLSGRRSLHNRNRFRNRRRTLSVAHLQTKRSCHIVSFAGARGSAADGAGSDARCDLQRQLRHGYAGRGGRGDYVALGAFFPSTTTVATALLDPDIL